MEKVLSKTALKKRGVLERKVRNKVAELLVYSDYLVDVVSEEPTGVMYDDNGKFAVMLWSCPAVNVIVTQYSITLNRYGTDVETSPRFEVETVVEYSGLDALLDMTPYWILESMKNSARDVLMKCKNSDDRVMAGTRLITSYYGRAMSLRRKFMLDNGIDFYKYASMLLKACESSIFKDCKDVWSILVKRFGLADGLAINKTYVFANE